MQSQRGRRVPTVARFVVAALVLGLTGAPGSARSAAASAASASASAAAPAGTLTTFAGGLGWGPAIGVAQQPRALAARDGRLLSVEDHLPLYIGGSGLVRDIDLATGQQRVLAGILVGGFRGDGGPATSAQLRRPTDAAIDATGNVYITDTENARIRRVSVNGTITTFAGNGVAAFSGEGARATSASIKLPQGIAISPSGDVVFADTGNLRVRKVSPSGTITTIAGTGQESGPVGDGGPASAAVLEPRWMAFDGAGNLYVSDLIHGSVRKITLDGTITTVATPAGFGSVGGLAVDGPGNIYGLIGTRVVKVDSSGIATIVAGAEGTVPPGSPNGDGGPAIDAHLTQIYDLAVDGGNLYLAETQAKRIRRVDAAGIITTAAGNGLRDEGGDGGPAPAAQFPTVNAGTVRSGPTGTYFASSTDEFRGVIRRVDPAGVISVIYEGTPVYGLAVDGAGNVYFSDGDQVRRLTPAGILSTVAGTGEAGFGGDGGPAVVARLSDPGSLAVDGAGNLYVADTLNGRIRRVDPLGIITTYVGGGTRSDYPPSVTLARDLGLGQASNLVVDAKGSLYWTGGDNYFKGIRKVTCGLVSNVFSTSWVRDGVSGMDIDAAGSIFFTTGDEVHRVDGAGRETTVAGSGGSVPLEGVPATSVALRSPNALAVHPSGRLLFGDPFGRVRQVDGVTAGRVTPGVPCDTTPDRPVWGVGYNALGQLGDGTTTDRDITDGENPPLTRVTAVTGGVGHSLALRDDGRVWAWGWNAYGQLGDGTYDTRLRPIPVPGLTGVVAVAGGPYHSLALKADGTVWTWGWNPLGQLGDGTTTTRLRPVAVPGLTGVVAISAGMLHSLAVRSDGSVWSWGWNGAGQLGDGSLVDHRLPARVVGISGATGVAAGGLHSLAVKGDGTVWSWGWNVFGQLGDDSAVDRRVPTAVVGLAGARAVSAGWYHSIALKADGTVAGWGLGHVGQTGNGSSASSLIPVVALGIGNVVAIASGAHHNVALLADGQVMAWGWDHFGQLGFDHANDHAHPTVISALNHTSAIGAGAYHSLLAYRLTS